MKMMEKTYSVALITANIALLCYKKESNIPAALMATWKNETKKEIL
jgi:hypothetical protein